MRKFLLTTCSLHMGATLISFAGAAPAAATQGSDLSTGELSAGRSDTLVCAEINKSGGAANLFVALKDPITGTTLPGGSNSCPATPNGASCSVAITHNSALPPVAYCHASTSALPVSGNLRLDSPTNVSKASSDVQIETPN